MEKQLNKYEHLGNKTLLEHLNREYAINIEYIKDMLRKVLEQGRVIAKEIKKVIAQYNTDIDINNYNQMLNFINTYLVADRKIKESANKRFKNEILEELYFETGMVFFDLLIRFNKTTDKFTKIASFINAFDNKFDKKDIESINLFLKREHHDAVKISPIFRLNNSDKITVFQPSPQFSLVEIKKIFGYNLSITFSNIYEIDDIYSWYRELFDNDILIIGSNLYFNIKSRLVNNKISQDKEAEHEIFQLYREFLEKYFQIHIKKNLNGKHLLEPKSTTYKGKIGELNLKINYTKDKWNCSCINPNIICKNVDIKRHETEEDFCNCIINIFESICPDGYYCILEEMGIYKTSLYITAKYNLTEIPRERFGIGKSFYIQLKEYQFRVITTPI